MPRSCVAIVLHLHTLIRIVENKRTAIKSAVEPPESNHTFTSKVSDDRLFLDTESAEKFLVDCSATTHIVKTQLNYPVFLIFIFILFLCAISVKGKPRSLVRSLRLEFGMPGQQSIYVYNPPW